VSAHSFCLPAISITSAPARHAAPPAASDVRAAGTDADDALPPPPPPPLMSSTDARAARMHAWMLACLQRRGAEPPDGLDAAAALFRGDVRAAGAALQACAPLALDLAAVAVVPLYEAWPAHEAYTVLNGALVALLTISTPAAELRRLSARQLQVRTLESDRLVAATDAARLGWA
jgi:hypothetical protein